MQSTSLSLLRHIQEMSLRGLIYYLYTQRLLLILHIYHFFRYVGWKLVKLYVNPTLPINFQSIRVCEISKSYLSRIRWIFWGVSYLTLASSSCQRYLAIFLGFLTVYSTCFFSLYPRSTGSPPYISPSPLKISAPSVLKFFGA